MSSVIDGSTLGSTLGDAIRRRMRAVAAQHGVALGDLEDATPLMATGLDSLCIAVLVAGLDDELGLDPFAAEDLEFPVTVGDFIALYDHAAG